MLSICEDIKINKSFIIFIIEHEAVLLMIYLSIYLYLYISISIYLLCCACRELCRLSSGLLLSEFILPFGDLRVIVHEGLYFKSLFVLLLFVYKVMVWD